MTVVTGFSWLSEMIIIADTRVTWKTQISWPGTSRPPQNITLKTEDVLEKLYLIRSPKSPQKAAVLGFSANDIHAAKTVITHLGKYKFQNYNRPLVMMRLKDDLHRWMEEITVKLTPKARDGLSFMLCGIESSRHPPILKNGKVIGNTPFIEPHIYTYSINATGKVHCNEKPTNFAVIGSGRKLEKEIRKQVFETIRFGFNQPNLHPARSHLITNIIASIFEVHQDIKNVGGPFQIIRITPNKLIQDFEWWPPSTEAKNIEVQQQDGKTIIYNPALKKEFTLYPVWEFPI